ncbi:hypothetical protein [Paenibacillus sp. Soil724D2]|uniref:hypothetical protein n=1 Tax=Paenibacillus sp. (strain Soil724D2) TaxID=1736392 RepID=UPI00071608B5|nr:hypothetical protein [Paenibacillus sp. Soil724D2]KRE50630.1 hypothetical protein ASG85_20470 [Paenibacillus sp. Soil724D2]
MTFQPQTFLRDAVSKGDMEQVRVGLSTYLSKNPTNEGNEVTDAAEYAASRLSEPLWLKHDNQHMESEKSKWTTDYLGLLKSDLRNNFSKERFLFIIEVGKVVRPYRGPAKTSPSQTQKLVTQRPVSKSRDIVEGKLNKKWLIIAALGGLLIILLLLFILQDKK